VIKLIDYEIKQKYSELFEKFNSIKDTVDCEKLNSDLKRIEEELSDPSIWEDQKKAADLGVRAQHLRDNISMVSNLDSIFSDLDVALELEEEDESMIDTINELLEAAQKKVYDFEFKVLLNDKFDRNSAFVSIHPGAGGTESQDWASMLLRMYLRWAEMNNYKINVVDEQPGEEAGIKSVTFKITGEYVYGKMKYESGVHRLVRISPFDSNSRRHTSFASLSVFPDINDEIEIDIKSEDLRVDTYRASGAGGQHVNKTDSAVRITHLPTGIVVACQIERSQHLNKATAMQMLKAKLYSLEMEKKQREKKKLMGNQKDIAWGSQIRSYVFMPYTMVKDHRTDYETGNINAVMDGYIDDFIEKELLYFCK